MQSLPDGLILALWLAFFGMWWVWSWRAKVTARAESFLSRGGHMVLLAASFLLLFARPAGLGSLAARWFPASHAVAWLGVAVLAGGFAFAAWARAALGKNWSAKVAVKEGHELVRSGPYGLVRHPIYTGKLLMFLGTAIVHGSLSAFAGTALLTLAYMRKSRMEERWMRQEFGPEYDRYAQDVRSLVPYVF